MPIENYRIPKKRIGYISEIKVCAEGLEYNTESVNLMHAFSIIARFHVEPKNKLGSLQICTSRNSSS